MSTISAACVHLDSFILAHGLGFAFALGHDGRLMMESRARRIRNCLHPFNEQVFVFEHSTGVAEEIDIHDHQHGPRF